MPARAIGSGTISFGLVSIPIKLYTATSAQSVSFNMLHKKCGGRMKQQYLCPVDNEIVARTDMVKGYEYSKDRFVQFTEEELGKLTGEKTDRLDIVEFVPDQSVDLLYVDKTYFLGPDKGGDRAYKLLSNAMLKTGKLAVGRFGTRGKEQLVLLRPYKGGLVLHYVYYADEVRSFDEVERPSENTQFKPVEEELAEKLIEQLSVEAFRPEAFRDEYRERVVAAVEQKVAGEEISVTAAEPEAQIIDLFEALKRSLGGSATTSANTTTAEEEAAPDAAAVEETSPALKKASSRKPREKKASGE